MKKTHSNTIKINEELCKGCGLCIFYCPDNALAQSEKFNKGGHHPVQWKGECSGCGRCYLVCPHHAIEIYDETIVER